MSPDPPQPDKPFHAGDQPRQVAGEDVVEPSRVSDKLCMQKGGVPRTMYRSRRCGHGEWPCQWADRGQRDQQLGRPADPALCVGRPVLLHLDPAGPLQVGQQQRPVQMTIQVKG